MDNLPRNAASGQSASIAPPELPDGWRYDEPEAWQDPRLAARRRWRALAPVALVGLVLALVIGISLLNGAAHYARGVQALKTHDYSWAADEFSAARVLGFPYRNAPSLEQQARRAADALGKQIQARTLIAQLDKAGARLVAGDAGGVLTTLEAIDAVTLRTALGGNGQVRSSADALMQDLAAASRTALRNGAWSRAWRFAAALLVLDPSSQPAMTLEAKAQTGQDLSVKLGEAKDAARRGRWQVALRLALAVLATQKDFPGAGAVVADARQALAPKPKPKPAVTTASSSTRASGGSGTTTAPQPPPP